MLLQLQEAMKSIEDLKVILVEMRASLWHRWSEEEDKRIRKCNATSRFLGGYK
jgi:hypothetical protein